MLVARQVAKSLGGRRIIEDVSLHLRRGEAVGLLGTNGTGKSTFFYMLAGMLPLDRGDILLDGQDVTEMPQYERARRGMSYLPQQPSVLRGLTVAQNIMVVLEAREPNADRRRERLEELMAQLGIAKVRNATASKLSGGERRRCEIARTLASQPSFILLDEPFVGIDPLAVTEIKGLIRNLTDRGIGVLITDHNARELLSLVDRSYVLNVGRVLKHGTPAEVMADQDVQNIYLGAGFRL